MVPNECKKKTCNFVQNIEIIENILKAIPIMHSLFILELTLFPISSRKDYGMNTKSELSQRKSLSYNSLLQSCKVNNKKNLPVIYWNVIMLMIYSINLS